MKKSLWIQIIENNPDLRSFEIDYVNYFTKNHRSCDLGSKDECCCTDYVKDIILRLPSNLEKIKLGFQKEKFIHSYDEVSTGLFNSILLSKYFTIQKQNLL